MIFIKVRRLLLFSLFAGALAGDEVLVQQSKAMKRSIIFCGSYPQIANALYVATSRHHNCPLTFVIPGNRDLIKFFQVVNERVLNNSANLIYFELYQARRLKANGISKLFYVFPDIVKERRYLKKIFNTYFAELKDGEVFFFGRGFCAYTFYLIKKLKKANRVVYIPDPSYDVLSIDKFTPRNIVDLASLTISKLIYGRNLSMGKLSDKKLPYMSNKFMEKEVDKVITIEERNELMEHFELGSFKICDVDNYSVIYFDGSLVTNGFIADEAIFRRELSDIFHILSKYFPEREIARKYHPHYSDDKAMIRIGDVLEDFVPAELLYNENVKMYLGVFSIALANVENGLAVSLADLISFKDEKLKDEKKEILIKRSRSQIIFPKSLDEFENIIMNITKAGT